MATKKNKFERTLTMGHKAIRNQNGKVVAADTADASSLFLQNLYAKRRKLERAIVGYSNIHPSDTTTLDVVNEGYDADQWVENINECKFKLAILNQKITIAEETDKEYFKD